MANIPVVRKRNNAVWFWVIAAVILVVILVALFGMRGDPTSPVSELTRPAETLIMAA
jgi:uncharacterized integral membrane protein